jgi:NADH:ubiquinone oxidoreductase subunit 3 (subunit A)
MLKTHFLIVVLFVITMTALTLILYLLSCIFFSTGIEDELQIERLYSYECGYSAFGDARDAFDIKFYLVAVLFLIFDLEISFLLPMAVTLSALSVVDYLTVISFLIILTIGFVYEWRKGGIEW